MVVRNLRSANGSFVFGASKEEEPAVSLSFQSLPLSLSLNVQETLLFHYSIIYTCGRHFLLLGSGSVCRRRCEKETRMLGIPGRNARVNGLTLLPKSKGKKKK